MLCKECNHFKQTDEPVLGAGVCGKRVGSIVLALSNCLLIEAEKPRIQNKKEIGSAEIDALYRQVLQIRICHDFWKSTAREEELTEDMLYEYYEKDYRVKSWDNITPEAEIANQAKQVEKNRQWREDCLIAKEMIGEFEKVSTRPGLIEAAMFDKIKALYREMAIVEREMRSKKAVKRYAGAPMPETDPQKVTDKIASMKGYGGWCGRT